MDPVRIADPDGWIDEIFAAKAVARGGVIRRDLRWIDREIGRERFVEEARARGFHLVETGGQWVVICNRGFFRVICCSNFQAKILIFRRKIAGPPHDDASAPPCAANRHGGGPVRS